jgi:hypothetical protein
VGEPGTNPNRRRDHVVALSTGERIKRMFEASQDRLDRAGEALREAAELLRQSNTMLRQHNARK